MKIFCTWKAALVVFVVMAASPALADATRTEEFRYPLNEGGRVSLENVNGDVRITGGDGGEVVIVATKRASREETLDRLEIRVDASPDMIRIDTRHPQNRWGWNNDDGGSVSYELTVPGAAGLDGIETVNGDVHVTGVRGEVRASTVNGDLELEQLAGDARLETVNGGIRASFLRLGDDQRITADTVNGRIEIRLPENAGARLTAETLNGSLDARDFGVETNEGRLIGRDIDAQIGTGTARIKLDTVNGSIRVRKS